MSKLQAPFTPLNIAILTVSDSRTLAEDTSGQYLVDQLTAAGHQLADRQALARLEQQQQALALRIT